jgi:hypothetical protein
MPNKRETRSGTRAEILILTVRDGIGGIGANSLRRSRRVTSFAFSFLITCCFRLLTLLAVLLFAAGATALSPWLLQGTDDFAARASPDSSFRFLR